MKFITYQKKIYIPFVMLALFLDFGQFRGTYMILIDSILNVKGLWARKRLAELISIFIETQKWNFNLWGFGVWEFFMNAELENGENLRILHGIKASCLL